MQMDVPIKLMLSIQRLNGCEASFRRMTDASFDLDLFAENIGDRIERKDCAFLADFLGNKVTEPKVSTCK